ncbi:glycosyl hydrolase [Anaerohalosphaeraceae bacterium U12dextr]
MFNGTTLTRRTFLQQSLTAAAIMTAGPTVISAADTTEGKNTIPLCSAVSANDFLDSIGICSAVSVRGENLLSTLKAVRYLGVRWIRAGYESGIPIRDLIEAHKRTGVRFSYGLMSGGTDLGKLLDGARQLAAVGALLALEGNNEPNNWAITYQGQTGGKDASWMAVAALQRDLYEAVKRDSVLKDYPVWNISESGAQTDNVGLQFLTIPNNAGCLMPDGTTYADYANCHNYMTHPSWAGLHDNQTWIAADPTSACKVDGLYGNYGVTWRKQYAGYSDSELLTLPRVTTETGITLDDTITEQVQALLYMSVYLAQFKRGWKYTSVYLLRDRSDEAGNQTFGFYRPDYTPRLAATYLHNLTTILADKSALATPGKLAYAIANQPDTVHDLLLQKQNGTFCLVVWGERFTGGEDTITITLDSPRERIKVYHPTKGISPVQILTKTEAIPLTLSNHPIIIEVA